MIKVNIYTLKERKLFDSYINTLLTEKQREQVLLLSNNKEIVLSNSEALLLGLIQLVGVDEVSRDLRRYERNYLTLE